MQIWSTVPPLIVLPLHHSPTNVASPPPANPRLDVPDDSTIGDTTIAIPPPVVGVFAIDRAAHGTPLEANQSMSQVWCDIVRARGQRQCKYNQWLGD